MLSMYQAVIACRSLLKLYVYGSKVRNLHGDTDALQSAGLIIRKSPGWALTPKGRALVEAFAVACGITPDPKALPPDDGQGKLKV